MLYNEYEQLLNQAMANPDVFNSEVLSEEIEDGQFARCSVAMLLTITARGRAVLTAHNNLIAYRISRRAFNKVLQRKWLVGYTVAYMLALTPECRAILAADNYRLARQISPEALNSIIQNGPDAKKSLAYSLASYQEGLQILAEDNYKFANLISPETLNTIIQNGQNAGTSVAYLLAANPKGRAILAANNYRLANLISPEALNSIIPNGPNAGRSVACLLALSSEGRAILAANNYRLARLISPETLNSIIQNGPAAGTSLAYFLAKDYNPESDKNLLTVNKDEETISQLISILLGKKNRRQNFSLEILGGVFPNFCRLLKNMLNNDKKSPTYNISDVALNRIIGDPDNADTVALILYKNVPGLYLFYKDKITEDTRNIKNANGESIALLENGALVRTQTMPGSG